MTRKGKQQPEPETRATKIAATWADPAVRAARTTRNAVKVGRTTYRSVREAFRVLGLPDSQHIRFRAELKAAGRATFAGHRFVLVANE